MIINVSIKSKRTVGLPHIQSPVAILFKDEDVLANHPLSCHPQRGVWQVGKCKKRKENEEEKGKAGKLSPNSCVFSKEKK